MKTVITAINAKFIHSSLAAHVIKQYCQDGDMNVMEFTVNQNENFITEKIYQAAPDIAAFCCYIWNIEMVLKVSSVLKKLMPDVKIILGGPEASYAHETLMEKNAFLDLIIVGEGEATFAELLQNKNWREIKGVVLRDGGQIIQTKNRENIMLTDIPFPYTDQNIHLFTNRILYYESARGCPYACSYCMSSVEEGLRKLPLARVYSDMHFFLRHNVMQVKFVDRTFNADPKFATAVWAFLMENDNQTTNFHFEIAGSLLTEEQITLLQKARKGLFQFEIGVQSVHEETLAAIHRNTDTDKIFENVRRMKKADNLHIHLDLIAGLPKESFLMFQKSFDLCADVRPHMIQLGFLKVLPGSQIKKDAAKYGLVYKNHPPYEILLTDCLSHDEMIKLRQIENIVEKYYNAALIPFSLAYVLARITPFSFFEKLADYFTKKHYDAILLSKMHLYTIFYEWTKQFVDAEILKELIKFDMLLNDNIKSFPYFIEKNERKAPKNKMNRIEIFSYDVLKMENGIEKRNTAVLFDYANRDKVSGKASYIRLAV